VTDVPVYVAIITGATGLVGALCSPLVIAYREGRQAKRDRLERSASDRRQACLALLDAAQKLRTQITGNFGYHGEEMSERLAAARELAASVQLNAAAVALMLPKTISVAGQHLAASAARLMDATQHDTDLNQKVMIRPPDFSPSTSRSTSFARPCWPIIVVSYRCPLPLRFSN
jgi:hypothetical protein